LLRPGGGVVSMVQEIGVSQCPPRSAGRRALDQVPSPRGRGASSSEANPEAAIDVALRELDHVYLFIYSRVGNRADAEDLTQQVALKALPKLRDGYVQPAVRGYLYTTARTVLASFWAGRGRIPEAELMDEVLDDGRGRELCAPTEAAAWVERTLGALPAHYRRILELRFLRGYSLKEAAQEMGKTVGGVKVMQLRALRAAAVVGQSR
jgi:RNA polymerase sigma factor (sigma-70 family)